MISVVIPLFNKERTVARAVKSVLAQSYRDFEVLVVDDGSTDNSLAEVARALDSRVKLLKQPNSGVSVARNRGIAEARSDWVAFLDADDEWLPGFLSATMKLRQQFPWCELAATSYYVQARGDGRRLPVIRGLAPHAKLILADYFRIACQSEPPVWSSAVCVSKRALSAIGGFPPGIKAGEDLLTWARLAVRYPIAYWNEPLAVFHADPACADGRPSREPDPEDRVGSALRALAPQVPAQAKISFRHYLALWYKMRASIYLRSGQHTLAWLATIRAIRLNPREPRLYGFLLASSIPESILRWLFRIR